MKLPEGFEILAYSSDCQIHCTRKNSQILTIQGHPEFKDSVIRLEIRLCRDLDIIPPDVAKNAMKSLKGNSDSVFFQKVIYNWIVSK